MTTTTIEIDRVAAVSDAIPEGTPLHMLNLLRFRESADYADGVAPAGGTGQEAFLGGYIPAFQQVVDALGFSGIGPVFAGRVAGAIVGADKWHAIAIVAYPDFATFRRIVESDAYASIAEPHRLAALEDLQLIATLAMDAQ